MKTAFNLLVLFLIGITFTSCTNRLVGAWTIEKYETTKPDQQAVSLLNIGTITFYKDGGGEKKITYSLFGETFEDNLRFKWSTNGKFVTIDSHGSPFSKTWIMVESTRKSQKWQSTDGGNQVEAIELKKIKEASQTTPPSNPDQSADHEN